MATQLPPDFYFKGYKYALKNAEDLYELSELAAKNDKIGSARSLNVLAAEEAIKAAFIITRHYHQSEEITDFEEIFRRHNIKHKHLKLFVEMMDSMQKATKARLAILTPYFENLKNISEETKARNRVMYDSVFIEYEFYKAVGRNEIDSGNILQWLEKANEIKNNGLYVGREKDVWLIPDDTGKEVYENEKGYTLQILQAVKKAAKTYSFIEANKTIIPRK